MYPETYAIFLLVEQSPFPSAIQSMRENAGPDGVSQMVICGQRQGILDLRAKPESKRHNYTVLFITFLH